MNSLPNYHETRESTGDSSSSPTGSQPWFKFWATGCLCDPKVDAEQAVTRVR